jgi:hypothetical protein
VEGPTLEVDVWYHVAATSSGGEVTLYVDGAPYSTGTPTLETGTGAFYIGKIGGSPGAERRLDGAVDEVAVYDRALTAEEIAALYADGAAGKCDP